MKTFRDRVVVITGAASGIGRATAHAFAAARAKLHLVDVHRERLETVTAELADRGAPTTAHVVDVRDSLGLERVAEAVYDDAGRCDVLVNNAGVGHSGLVHELRLDDWKWVLDVNLWGVIHGIHAFAPRMIDQGGDAHIVNVASVAGLVGLPAMAPYCASKFAVVGVSESLGAELAPHGIKVSVVCPGVINTDIVRSGRLEGSVGSSKRRIVDFYRRRGLAPERVAHDILRAIRADKPIQLTLGSVASLLWVRRLSPRLWRGAASFVQRRVLGGEG